jgi:ABC-2 type transport system ATP-binding protein
MTAIDASSGSSAAPHASAPGRIALEARGIRRTYGAVVALEGLSFAARAGEVVGVLGPNGAGKTTAIRVLTTILPPSAGSFEVAGVPHTRPSEIRRRIGVLPESAGYPEQQTGFEFLRYHARLFGLSRTAAGTAASALLDEVGLAERGGAPIGTYSRGMRQRLGIARALVNEPAVAFFDEPTLGLDPAGQRHVLRLVLDIARTRGTSVILSTHVLAEVEEICSRVLILGRGRVLAEGTVEEVTRRAAAPRRARFRVPGQARDRALIALGGLGDVEPADGRADWVVATLAGTDATREAAQRQIHDAMGALAREGIPLLAFELEGARLSDAFLALTEDG